MCHAYEIVTLSLRGPKSGGHDEHFRTRVVVMLSVY